MPRRLAFSLVLALVAAPAIHGYLKLGTSVGSRIVSLTWSQQPIRYFITDRGVPGVTAEQLRAATASAFGEWTSVPTVALSSEFVGFTGAEPFDEDGVSVVGFRFRPELERTLGATTFEIDTVTGSILESDIFLNSDFDWSVASAGQAGRFDVESIMVHELGHLLGLGHSALGETELVEEGRRRVLGKRAVMFPIAFPSGNIEDRTLEADDRAGLTDLYGSSDARRTLGSINGRVTLGGQGVFGAHVTAFNPATGVSVSSFALDDNGGFVVAGLEPGLYVVRAEPLDDADIDSFFDEDTDVEMNFRPAYAPRLVAVPSGGSSGTVEIRVAAK